MRCPTSSFESVDLGLGDCIGVESCLDFKTMVDFDGGEGESFSHGLLKSHHLRDGCGRSRMSRSDQWCLLERTEKCNFPPPMPSLGHPHHCMPWIMKRCYTDDGRLVITGEKVKHQEYFQADRSNGRLTLRLVPIYDDDDDEESESEYSGDGGDVDSEELGDEKLDDDDVGRIDNHQPVLDNGGHESIVSNQELGTSFLESGAAVVAGSGGGGGKMYQYCNMSRNSCMFEGIAMAAVRSVHT